MKKNIGYSVCTFSILLSVITLIIACNKDEDVTGITAQERYINTSGQGITITRYITGADAKSFTIANEDTLYIESSLDGGADSTGTIFRADSARVVFEDGKSYSMKDTTSSSLNFLKPTKTISPSGKTHYFRYHFTESDYALGE